MGIVGAALGIKTTFWFTAPLELSVLISGNNIRADHRKKKALPQPSQIGSSAGRIANGDVPDGLATVCSQNNNNVCMFSPNRPQVRTATNTGRGKTRRSPLVPQKLALQQQPSNSPVAEEHIGIRLPLLLNKPITGSQSVFGGRKGAAAAAANRLPPPPPPPRSATTSLTVPPTTYQGTNHRDTPFDQRPSSDFLHIRLETLQKPYWAQASLTHFSY